MVYPLIVSFLLMISLCFPLFMTQYKNNTQNKTVAFKWKICFNPDLNKQAQEVIFSRKLKKVLHLSLCFNNSNVSQVSSQKQLGLTLANRLTFDKHLNIASNKISENLRLLRKLQNTLPRSALLTIYKCFMRPDLDYGDIIYGQAYNLSFHKNLELI